MELNETHSELSPSWYAVYTRSKAERSVVRDLEYRYTEAYLPAITEVHRWKDRNKTIERAVFPGYVFARITNTAESRVRILGTPGVVRILGTAGEIEAIPEIEVESLRRLIDSRALMTVCSSFQPGDPVRVKRGALEGVEGKLVRIKNATKLVISIHLLSQAVATEVDVADVEPVTRPNLSRVEERTSCIPTSSCNSGQWEYARTGLPSR